MALIGSALANPAPKSKTVSRYMRDMGILYLETVDKLDSDCHCQSAWEAEIKSLEDRVDIALNDKAQRRPPGDAPYWDLLKSVRWVRPWYVNAGDSAQRKVWGHVYATCAAYAHTVAIEGDYFNGDGGCGDEIDPATHQ
jgi:hypothetical protein